MISLYSTYSRDKIFTGTKIIEKPGGPLFFIESALKDLNVNYNSFFGKTASVEIKVQKNSEIGRMTTLPMIQKVLVTLPSQFVVVSTMFNEWDMLSVDLLKNEVFVDIQGYVRDVKKMGKKKVWKEIEEYSNRIFCLKGTKEEMSYIPRDVFKDQKKRLLVITNGEKGVKYYFKGKEHFEPVKRRIVTKDTIGVGDTFFGFLVGYLYMKRSLKFSIQNAIKKTETFLESKTKI